ncbi:MAG: T9SS type A sorting domain-containing protein [Bacteroidota bacterium]
MKKIVLYFLLGFYFGKAQRITDFSLNTAANIVTGKFTITPGSVCGGFTVYRSTDSLNYFQIYDSPQVCGNYSTPETKSFSDASPAINQYNFYKIFLQPYDVAIQKIYVGKNQGSNMITYPNPVYQGNSTLNLKLINAGNTNVFGYLFNQGARSLQKLDLYTSNDLTAINVAGLENGVYLIWLTDGNVAFSTKFIVLN